MKQKQLTEEQKKLIEDNLEFCYYWFNLHNIYSEDTQQTLLYNVCKYIHLYDSSRGMITTFITQILESRFSQLPMYNQSDCRRINNEAISLSTPIYSDGTGEDITLEEAIESLENGFDAVEAKIMINNIIKNVKADATLTEMQVKMFLTWVETRNYAFCGKAFNLTRQRAEQIIKGVCKIIKEHHLDGNNLDSHYQRFTYPEIKDRFFALNRNGGEPEQAVVVIKPTIIHNKIRDNRSFIISSTHPYFSAKANKLSGIKLSNKNGPRYILSKWIKNEINDVETVYLL